MSRKYSMPHHIRPMLATLVAEPFDRTGWYFEIKWDGYRAIAEVDKGKVRLYSRNQNPFDNKYPSIVAALNKVKHSCVLDGEIIALSESGKPDFHTLQNYDEAHAPLQYCVFDLLYLDGRDLRDCPLFERKALLASILPRDKRLVLSAHIEMNGKRFFKEMQKLKLEGMIAKDSMAPYREGYRGSEWLKVKTWMEQEAVIVGFTEPRGSRKNLGALVLAAHVKGKLTYIGHSGGGFTHQELKELCAKLSEIETNKPAITQKVPVHSPITWVKPKYVCEIKFTEWTPDGHMRHPIYTGMRPDKKWNEVVKELPI